MKITRIEEELIEKVIKDEDGFHIRLAIRNMLMSIGEDVTREGITETPARVAKFWEQWVKREQDFELTVFDSEGMDQLIIQKNIPFYSMCEHHLLPFFGEAAIAYIPNGKIVGLSKLARLAQFHSSKPQNQERITQAIANQLQNALEPVGVAVVLKARHMCMEMRGIRAYGTMTMTSYLTGVFKSEQALRQEFFDLVRA